MKTNEKIEELNYIKLAYQTNKFDEERLQESIESLAKEKSIAFFDFLKSLLYDPRLFWKSISIDNMIYFKNEIDKHTIDKIQKLFGLENDVDLKISAAHLLGFSDKDSEEFLYSVYKKESNVYVKSAIAASILLSLILP